VSFAEAQAVARRIAALASGRLGEPLWLRDYPVEIVGEIGRVVVGLSRGALHRVIALVHDLGSMRTATVEVTRPDGPAIEGHQLRGGTDEAAIAAAIAAAVADRAEPWPLGLLDAGYGLLDALGQRLGVPGGRWRLSTWGEWDPRRSGVSVELAGGPHEWTDLISIGPADARVAIRIHGARMGAGPSTRTVATPGELIDALGGIVDDVRAAIDGRATFRARPGVAGFARELVDAIRSAHALRGTLRVAARDAAGFPDTWPTATIERVDDQGGHTYVALADSPAGVTVTVDTPRGPYPDFAAAAADLPAILDEIRAAGERLRPDHLIKGRIYTVLAPIVAAGMRVEPGTRLRFIGIDHVPREEFAIYRFTAADAGDARLELAGYHDRDVEVLRRLHELLAADQA
jgi:hypothetical protein